VKNHTLNPVWDFETVRTLNIRSANMGASFHNRNLQRQHVDHMLYCCSANTCRVSRREWEHGDPQLKFDGMACLASLLPLSSLMIMLFIAAQFGITARGLLLTTFSAGNGYIFRTFSANC
jgi:hypothetical protein